jgi:hypothetical protein
LPTARFWPSSKEFQQQISPFVLDLCAEDRKNDEFSKLHPAVQALRKCEESMLMVSERSK